MPRRRPGCRAGGRGRRGIAAPNVFEYQGQLYLTGNDTGLYRSASPEGPWEYIGDIKDAQGNKLPYLDGIKWKIIKDDTARVVALRSGEVQVITPVPPAGFDQLKSASGVSAGESPLLGTISIGLLVAVAFGGVFGDLVESMVKRQAQVKDAGEWLPGFGGPLPEDDPG